jgi:hypothetical protein
MRRRAVCPVSGNFAVTALGYCARLSFPFSVAATGTVPFEDSSGGAVSAAGARAGHCATCGYDLTANVSGVCPKCNTLASGDHGPGARGMR